ncbi:MAG: DUF1934 domain-containing protein [Evtepia sp.]
MNEQAIISIKGTQWGADGQPDVIEFVTQGSFFADPSGTYLLSYPETELTGLEGTTTTFSIQGDRVTLSRSGALDSEMILEEGQKHISLYNTPYGGFTLGVTAQCVRTALSKDGGELDLQYSVELEDTPIGNNMFEIKIRRPALRAE